MRGIQVASRTWAFRHQGHGGQSATKSCSSNSAGGRQTHAVHGLPGERQNVISSCVQWEGHGAWSSPTDGQFYWKHPTKEVHVKGTLLVDASSRAAVVRTWRTAPRQELLGHVSASEARQMLQESWFKCNGRPETVMTDPEGCFRERLFREWLASKNVKRDPQPAEAAWRIGILDKVLDVLKNAATRAARRAPEDTSCETLFDDCTEAHNELHRRRGYSPFQLLIGRSHLDCHWMETSTREKEVRRSRLMVDIGCTFNGSAVEPILTKK